MNAFKLVASVLILAMIIAVFYYIYKLPAGIEQDVNMTVNKTPAVLDITPSFTVSEPSTVYVDILGTMFDPPELTVVNGTTVRWKNSDNAIYMINVNNYSSPRLQKRETWNYTFNDPGIYEYNCSLHPAMPGGRIIVKATK